MSVVSASISAGSSVASSSGSAVIAWRSRSWSPDRAAAAVSSSTRACPAQHGGKAGRQPADPDRVHALGVHQGGHFHRDRAGQVRDQAVVERVHDVAVAAGLDDRRHDVGDHDALVLGAVRQVAEPVLPALGGPPRGHLLPGADALALGVHVVDAPPVAHRQALRPALVRLLQALQLGEELRPVRPAVGQHAECRDRPAHQGIRAALGDQGQGVASVAQPQRHDAGAVIDAAHPERQVDLVLADPGLGGQPAAVERQRGAGTE